MLRLQCTTTVKRLVYNAASPRTLWTSKILSEDSGVKSMREMPGPTGLPLLGTTLEYLRLKERAYTLFFDRAKTYGTIYKEKLIAGFPLLVNILDPVDIEAVFRSDGKYPDRPQPQLFHEMRDSVGMPVGLLLSVNEEWHRQRQPISQFMMLPRKVGEYHKGFNEVTQDLIAAIKLLRSDTDMVSNVPNLLFKWSFESVSLFTLGKRLGALNIGNVPTDCQEIIDATQILFEGAQKAFFAPPIHKIYPTKLWKSLLGSQRKIYKLSMSLIEEKMEEVKNLKKQMTDNNMEEIPDNMDYLTYMLLSEKIKTEEITTNAVDFLFAGIDTTSYTLVWCLYNLATNKDVQSRLRSEINEVVAENETITPEHIHKLRLLRNCVTETLRLYSLVSFFIRRLQQDVVLSGYNVPAGTLVLIPMLVIGRLKENYPYEPNKFIPDRWNREGEYPKNRFVHLPFGFGPRMCIGRRVAELELHIAIAQIVRNFLIDFPESKPMDFIMKGVLVPERQFNLVFKDLK